MPTKKKGIAPVNPLACVFCYTDEDNEYVFGKFLRNKELSVHQNCMFFASGLSQHEKKSSKMLGFKTSDIKKEVLRGKRLKCVFCKQMGATIGCTVAACRKTFHFPCGRKNLSLNQYFGSFKSFCKLHKPVQKYIKTPKDEFHCHICFSSLAKTAVKDRLYSTCCKNNWYHMTCLQQYATSAGRHFFNCPKCKNSSNFTKDMEIYGINIPEKDASWELEENAFEDLLYRPKCSAKFCKCDKGRDFNGDSAWELLFCKLCGSNARHRFCEKLVSTVDSWTCNECKILDEQIEINRCKPCVSEKAMENLSGISSLPDCQPSCSDVKVVSTETDSFLRSVPNLKRALRCVVQVTPLKIITDINGVSRPILLHNNECKQVIPGRKVLNFNNRMERALCKNNNSEKIKQVTLTENKVKASEIFHDEEKGEKQISSYTTNANSINKSMLVKQIENDKREQALDIVVNKLDKENSLQERAINTFKNKELKNNSKYMCKDSLKKAKIPLANVRVKKSKINMHGKCSGITCISKYFGFDCSKLKDSQL